MIKRELTKTADIAQSIIVWCGAGLAVYIKYAFFEVRGILGIGLTLVLALAICGALQFITQLIFPKVAAIPEEHQDG